MNYEIKNENILYKKILNANLFAGLFEQDFESSFEHPTVKSRNNIICLCVYIYILLIVFFTAKID